MELVPRLSKWTQPRRFPLPFLVILFRRDVFSMERRWRTVYVMEFAYMQPNASQSLEYLEILSPCFQSNEILRKIPIAFDRIGGF
jgi:hypothetical protein